jgi:hypothetical protein
MVMFLSFSFPLRFGEVDGLARTEGFFVPSLAGKGQAACAGVRFFLRQCEVLRASVRLFSGSL